LIQRQHFKYISSYRFFEAPRHLFFRQKIDDKLGRDSRNDHADGLKASLGFGDAWMDLTANQCILFTKRSVSWLNVNPMDGESAYWKAPIWKMPSAFTVIEILTVIPIPRPPIGLVTCVHFSLLLGPDMPDVFWD